MGKQALIRGAGAALLLGFVVLIGGVACIPVLENSLDTDAEFSNVEDTDSLDTDENSDSDTGEVDTTVEDSEGTDTSTEEATGTDSVDVKDSDTVDTATDLGPPADPSCEPIGSDSFGTCGELLGFAIRATNCIPIDGCLDQAPLEIGFYSTLNECETACTGCSSNEDCLKGEMCDFLPQADCGRLMTGSCIIPKTICTTVKGKEVCGCDGVTYSNVCRAHDNGVSVAYEGKCSK